MRQLNEKQAREEQELLARAASKSSTSPKDPIHRPPSVSMPVSPHSSSGNASPNGVTLAADARRTASNGTEEPRRVSDAARDARSMPGSRRHSGEADTQAVVEGMTKLSVNGYVADSRSCVHC